MTYEELLLDIGYAVGYNIILIVCCLVGFIFASKAHTPIPWILFGVVVMAVLYYGQSQSFNANSFFLAYQRDRLTVEIICSFTIVLVSLLWGTNLYKNKKATKREKISTNDNSAASSISTSALESSAFQQSTSEANKIISAGGWRCAKCGKVNFQYESNCSCGASKFDIKSVPAPQENDNTEKDNTEKTTAAPKTDKSLSEQLTELRSLVDAGLITQDDYDAKKKQILGL